MPLFKANNRNELEHYLYDSHIHDATIVHIEYLHSNRSLTLETFNSFFDERICFTFSDITYFKKTKSNALGSSEVILGLDVGDGQLYLEELSLRNEQNDKKTICLQFEMFSGAEFHFVAEAVEIKKAHST